jgi:hypothetical protein
MAKFIAGARHDTADPQSSAKKMSPGGMNRCREEGVDRWLDIEPPQLPIVVRSVDIVQVVHRSSLSTRPNRKYWNHAWCVVPSDKMPGYVNYFL